jgi:endonuclease-3
MPPSLGSGRRGGNAPGALAKQLQALEKLYGRVQAPPATGPLELILWENVAYLTTDARRAAAFKALRAKVGTTAARILKVDPRRLHEALALGGILPAQRVGKLLKTAELVEQRFGGDLDAVLRLPPAQAMKALRTFPGIGEPGAEKILLFTGVLPVLAVESNGLRVLLRLGYGAEKKSYSATYRSAQAAAARELAEDCRTLQRSHLLLRRHGQELCRRSAPRCPECPLSDGCAFARSTGRERTSGRRGAR